VKFVSRNINVREGDLARIEVVRDMTQSNSSDVSFSIDYETVELESTAEANSDYIAKQGTLNFAAGVMSQFIEIQTLPQNHPIQDGEDSEFIVVNLKKSISAYGVINVVNNPAIITIEEPPFE
jgi:hypothetical protein